jgi:phosphate transport system substrate-binding protein
VGVGGKGNEAVAGLVRQLPGAIGYVELIYALQNKITFAAIKNAAGNWITASIPGVTAAAGSIKSMPVDFRVSITDAPGGDAYPISSFSWIIVSPDGQDAAKRKVLKDMLSWAVKSGESEASALSYAPLPQNVAQKELEAIYALK